MAGLNGGASSPAHPTNKPMAANSRQVWVTNAGRRNNSLRSDSCAALSGLCHPALPAPPSRVCLWGELGTTLLPMPLYLWGGGLPPKQGQCNPMGACDLDNPQTRPRSACPRAQADCDHLLRPAQVGRGQNSLRSDNGPALSDLNRPDQMALPAKIRDQANRARSTVPPCPGLASQLW